MGGIYTALEAARHELVVIVACDLPFVTQALLDRLIVEASDEVDAVVPRSSRGLEPLCAVYRKRCAPVVRERIDQQMLQVSTLPDVLRVRELGPESLGPMTRTDGCSRMSTRRMITRAPGPGLKGMTNRHKIVSRNDLSLVRRDTRR